MEMNDNRWIKETLVIAFVSLVLALIYNMFSSEGLELFPEEEAPNASDSELFSDGPKSYDEIFEESDDKSVTDSEDRETDQPNDIDSRASSAPVKEPEKDNSSSLPKGNKSGAQTGSNTDNSPKDIEEDFSQNKLPSVDGFPTISIDQLRRAVGDDRFIILDARPPASYAKDHVPGAINIYPLGDEEELMPALLSLPRDKKFLIYCTSSLCDLGHELALLMSEFEYQNMYIYVPGWEGWINNGGMGGK
jgi:rhodanese-related sulfurtransferase